LQYSAMIWLLYLIASSHHPTRHKLMVRSSHVGCCVMSWHQS